MLKKIIPGLVGIYQFLFGIFLLPRFIKDFNAFSDSSNKTNKRFSLEKKDVYLCLFDKTDITPFDPHYTYHPAWAARILATTKPSRHTDIASILSFPTIVSAFVPVDYYDYRPANLNLEGMNSRHGDLHHLPFADDSVESLSCMHTIEHIGLGRYGEPIDYDGDIKAINELKRVLAKGGSLLFVTPVGQPKIEFNAHRIYAYEQIMELFSDLTLKEFSLVPDDYKKTGLIRNASPELVKNQLYGCGCFWFTK